ncbi:hypothetical protein [Pectobacterium polaris]|uniref:hypothetical protein n=1 Tax=Pectobacterium polaris TaxID=2042057 RepID=UPI001584455D|nr:hypothetical protein [Pectobacterium polaris]
MRKKIINPKINLNAKHILKNNLKGERSSALEALYRLKSFKNTEFFEVFRELVDKKTIERVSSTKLPTELNKLLCSDGMLQRFSVAKEILWSISNVLLYKEEIKEFIFYKNKIELAILNDDISSFEENIELMKKTLGWSYWLVENNIAAKQHWLGNDSKREYVREIRDKCINNPTFDLLVFYVSKRVEATALPGYLRGELYKLFKEPGSKHILEYFNAKLFENDNFSIDQVTLLLAMDFNSSIVDLYESLITVLRWVINSKSAMEQLSSLLTKPLKVLANATKDERLNPILIAFGIDITIKIDPKRESIIENYTAGNYRECNELTREYFNNPTNTNDIPILLLGLKSEGKENDSNYEGLLKTISTEVRGVFKLNDNSYSAALTLNQLHEKFRSHNWSQTLRLSVMNELTVQDFSSALDYLRSLYVLEPRVTPFSLILSDDKKYIERGLNQYSGEYYKLSRQLINLTLNGIHPHENTENNITLSRKLKYLGRFYLMDAQYSKAIETFNLALEYTDHSESLKCHAALIIAKLRLGDCDNALISLVNAYLKWGAIPTALPFEEVINNLDDPDLWPSSICLPITLALYTHYFRNDKVAHLRYAFEKFNLDNSINIPSDLTRNNLVDVNYAKLYLQLVWRPEIMGQTLLYNGSKEIEEARIQVCKLLVEIDPENAAEYQTEIRERVKNLELAKVTNLVEQSRVYVDVSAIKKTLKAKLSDIYSKYKNTIILNEDGLRPIDEVIEDVFEDIESPTQSLTSKLSQYHILGDEDMQFAAIFSEVVNEFLLGEHGLNAYLSTRVRHGKFSNAIRKPIADEHLITEVSEGTGEYSKNIYWENELSHLNDEERNNVLLLLEHFGKKIDEIIAYVRDELIQVTVHDDIVGTISSPFALFVYRSSSLERVYAKAKLVSLDNIDDFIDFCIDTLWQKTDDILINVKAKILGDIKGGILQSFDKLSESLGKIGYSDRLGELPNHIARAKTNIQHHILNVSSWFTRNEVYDRPDHTQDFPVLVAKKMVSNLISGADTWDGIKISTHDSHSNLPGRTLDGMVDIYCAIFENAIEHSGISIGDLEIHVSVSYQGNHFKVGIINNIDTSIHINENMEKIKAIKQELIKKDTRAKAQKEKGSGFHKMWSTINSPLYENPNLSFEYTDDNNFLVEIEYTLEAMDEQAINH